MNFKKLMIAVAAVVVLVVIWKAATHVNRSNPVAVATAFTNALKSRDISAASRYYLPDQAAAWEQQTNERVTNMRSGAGERFFERIPAAPAFTSPVTAGGKTTIVSGDKNFSLEITQINGKWYVATPGF